MKTTIIPDAKYWASLAIQTRKFGHCYVHTEARQSIQSSYIGAQFEGIRFHYSGYGRSLQSGGHKFKVHATFSETGKPVPTKTLKAIQ